VVKHETDISGSLSVPFFIGLIGHRDIDSSEKPRILAELDSHLERIISLIPHTKIVVLTALASGADSLIFESRLRERVEICAVLPMSVKEYSRDFQGQALRDFKLYLSQCKQVIEVPKRHLKRDLAGEIRNQAYRNCGSWISDRSNILIAIWNGKKNFKTGGTADIVTYRLENVLAKSHDLVIDNDFIHILGSNGKETSKPDCSCDGHRPLSKQDKRIIRSLEKLNGYLQDFSSLQESKGDLALAGPDNYLYQLDRSAVKLKKRYLAQTLCLVVLGLVAANTASMALNVGNFSPIYLLSIGVFLLTTGIWRLFHRSRSKTAYETFRFAAEIFRIEIWWKSNTLDKCAFDEAFESYDFDGRAPLFISNIFLLSTLQEVRDKQISTYARSSSEPKKSIQSDTSYIQTQIKYLKGSEGNKGAISRNAGRNIQLLVATYFLVSIATLTFLSLGIFYREKAAPLILNLVFTFCWTAAALLAAFNEAMGYQPITQRYKLKLKMLELSEGQLGSGTSNFARKEVLYRVGQMSIAESIRWFQIRGDRRHRPFQ